MTGLLRKYIHTGLSLKTPYTLPEAQTVGSLLKGLFVETKRYNKLALEFGSYAYILLLSV